MHVGKEESTEINAFHFHCNIIISIRGREQHLAAQPGKHWFNLITGGLHRGYITALQEPAGLAVHCLNGSLEAHRLHSSLVYFKEEGWAVLRGASTLPHSQQAQGFTQSQEPEQEFTLLPTSAEQLYRWLRLHRKKNFMHSKTVKCILRMIEHKTTGVLATHKRKKSTEVKKSSDCKNCILFKRASKIPTRI